MNIIWHWWHALNAKFSINHYIQFCAQPTYLCISWLHRQIQYHWATHSHLFLDLKLRLSLISPRKQHFPLLPCILLYFIRTQEWTLQRFLGYSQHESIQSWIGKQTKAEYSDFWWDFLLYKHILSWRQNIFANNTIHKCKAVEVFNNILMAI